MSYDTSQVSHVNKEEEEKRENFFKRKSDKVEELGVKGFLSKGLPRLDSRPGQSQGMLYKQLCHSLID